MAEEIHEAVDQMDTDCDLASARVSESPAVSRKLTIQEQVKQDWMDAWFESYIYEDVVRSGDQDLSTLAEAAWAKHVEDGPDDPPEDLRYRNSPSFMARELAVKDGGR